MNVIKGMLQLLRSCLFLVTLDPDEAGVRIRAGRWMRPLGSGIHFVFPLIDSVRAISTALQSIDLPEHSVHGLYVSGIVWYRVRDPLRALVHLEDVESLLSDLVVSSLTGILGCSSDLSFLSIQRNVLEQVGDQAEDLYGVEVTDFRLTDYNKHRVLRLVGLPSIRGSLE